MIKDYLQILQTFKEVTCIKCRKTIYTFPWKQTEKGCIHCSVNPQESVNSIFPRMKYLYEYKLLFFFHYKKFFSQDYDQL